MNYSIFGFEGLGRFWCGGGEWFGIREMRAGEQLQDSKTRSTEFVHDTVSANFMLFKLSF